MLSSGKFPEEVRLLKSKSRSKLLKIRWGDASIADEASGLTGPSLCLLRRKSNRELHIISCARKWPMERSLVAREPRSDLYLPRRMSSFEQIAAKLYQACPDNSAGMMAAKVVKKQRMGITRSL